MEREQEFTGKLRTCKAKVEVTGKEMKTRKQTSLLENIRVGREGVNRKDRVEVKARKLEEEH